MTIIGVDVGTSLVKAVAFDSEGEALAVTRREARVSRPRPGWSEQEMDEVWRAVASATAAIAERSNGDVEALAFTAQGDGCWLVDEQLRPTGPAILWNDARACGVVDRWMAEGVADAAFAVNGSVTFSGLANAILAWLAEHEPERLRRSAAALTCGGWIFARLTGELGVDPSDASAPFFDIRRRRYAPELLERFGLEWAERLLPPVRGDGRRLAPLSDRAAAELGLPPGLPVVMAPYDVAATMLGVGATRPGDACSILGTTLCTGVVVDSVPSAGPRSGVTLALDGGRWLRAFPTMAGTEVVSWAVRELGIGGYEELSRLVDGVPAGSHGLFVLPYLSPAGERAPFLAPDARGAVIGVSLEHDRAHLARAVLEGLAFVVRDCLRACSAAEHVRRCGLCGGGAANDVWCQMLADVTGVPTFRTHDAEVGAKGAYLVALAAIRRTPDVETAALDRVRVRDRFEPDAERSARYADLFDRFVALREVAAAQWRQLGELRAAAPA